MGTLIRSGRLVPIGTPAPEELMDLRISGGRITAIAPTLTPQVDDEVLNADGRWAMPGFWDQHVHFSLWAQNLSRLDTSGTGSVAEVLRLVTDLVASQPEPTTPLVGFGHRCATWPEQPSVAELDAISGDHPIVLISGDAHSGWCNTRALRLLGGKETGAALTETDWFPLYDRLSELPGAGEVTNSMLQTALDQAAALGVVGIVDFDFTSAFTTWPNRVGLGLNSVRVKAATYPHDLDQALAAGHRTGDPLPGGDGLVTMGPLKIISDGSLNTRTAWCHEPYADSAELAHPRGTANLGAEELRELLTRATQGGLEVAVHAIGDAAVGQALDAVAATGARGSIEHAQLIRVDDLTRLAALPLRASMQPAHLLDDRDVSDQCWPDRGERCFMLASLRKAGVPLALGSDAPVSPLDPWLTLAAAVHRSADERQPWHGEEALSVAEALSASLDGHGTLAVGSPADLLLLDENPLLTGSSEHVAARLLTRPVAATMLAGRLTYSAL